MLYWIWLTQIKGVGPIIQRSLLRKFTTPEEIYKASLQDLLECEGIGINIGERVVGAKSLENANNILEQANRLGIKILTLEDPLYPEEVKQIAETPTVLYYNGNLIPNSMGVAIVGARRCSEYGKTVTKEAATYLANRKICVVSGMAKGVDGYAHISCLKAGGYTIAVLGHGLDMCYPSEHRELMEKIIENGAVISEYPPGVKPDPKHFPRRNLLISGWVHKILVVEAGESSGSLITAGYGKKYKRQVLAVPDNMYRKESIGSNKLISEGANIYLHKEQLLIENKYDFMEAKTFNSSVRKDIKRDLSQEEKSIIEVLQEKGPKTVEELSGILEIDIMKLLEITSLMELEDRVFIQGSMVKLV